MGLDSHIRTSINGERSSVNMSWPAKATKIENKNIYIYIHKSSNCCNKSEEI